MSSPQNEFADLANKLYGGSPKSRRAKKLSGFAAAGFVPTKIVADNAVKSEKAEPTDWKAVWNGIQLDAQAYPPQEPPPEPYQAYQAVNPIGVVSPEEISFAELRAKTAALKARQQGYPTEEPALEDGKVTMNIETTKINKIVKFAKLPEGSLDVDTAYEKYDEYLTSKKAAVPRARKVPKVVRNTEVMVGIELELEGMETLTKFPILNSGAAAEYLHGLVKKIWTQTKDDSLRGESAEWVSRVGLKAGDAGKALSLMKLHLDSYFSGMQVNYRCGTHVHVNVRDFTVEQLVNMTMLYILFEDLFYKVSGERYKNNFCVPIRASMANVEQLFRLATLSKPTYQEFRNVFTHFTKYMAFNILPAGKGNGGHPALGTVEFRHHQGESDPVILTQWIQYICDIHYAAQQYSFTELRDVLFRLNTASNYIAFAKSVFSNPIPIREEQLALDMYEGSSHIKELYIQAKGL